MADIFVSYASEDRERVRPLVERLEAEGLSVWWDTHIDLGETYDEVIEAELEAAKVAIVVWTKQSKKSRWVRSEATRAERLEKFVPIMLERDALPLQFELIQTENFIDWGGDTQAECWKRLLLKVRAHVGHEVVIREAGKPLEVRQAVPVFAADGGASLTFALLMLFAGGFIGSVSAGSPIIGGAFFIAGAFFLLFRAADTQLPMHLRALVGRWLLPQADGVRVNVAETFNTLFEAVFGARHLSWKCLLRSAFASSFFFAAFLGFALLFVEPVRVAFRNEWGSYLGWLIVTFVIANIFGDYLSLWQTRLFLRWTVKSPGLILPIVVLDAIFTLMVYLGALYAVAVGLQYAGNTFGGLDIVYAPGSEAEGGLDQAREADPSLVREAAPEFTVPDPLTFYQGLIPQLAGMGAQADLWARSWVLIFSVMTTYVTSVWLWLVLFTGPFVKPLLARRQQPTWLGRLLHVERVPYTVFGMISAAYVMVLAIPASYFWPLIEAEVLAGRADAEKEVVDLSGGIRSPGEETSVVDAAQLAVGDVFKDCPDCPEMVVLPAGSFLRGSEDGASDERPVREVTIPARFAVGQFEVTWSEWEACVVGGGCTKGGVEASGGDGGWGRGRRPVINVSWGDAKAYVAWLSAKTGHTYRLLSEAEWEYAARAGTTTPYSTGKTISTKQANFRGDNFLGQTVPVGSYAPNTFGLYDMHGNVWEWVEDCYKDSYEGAPTDGSAWLTGECGRRVLRGGSWGNEPQHLRSAFRSWNSTDGRGSFGFRVSRTF